MKQYLELLNRILNEGTRKSDRTGTFRLPFAAKPPAQQ